MTDQTPKMMYFIVRTDVSAKSGQQRLYDAFDDEATAAQECIHLMDRHAGTFEVFGGSSVGGFVRDKAPIRYVPKTASE